MQMMHGDAGALCAQRPTHGSSVRRRRLAEDSHRSAGNSMRQGFDQVPDPPVVAHHREE
jgi:hypothetical protein